jgi:hypothetical protein
MAVIAIGIGLFVFLFTGAFISEVVLHNKDAGVFPGLVLGIWAAWPFFHHARIQRSNLLHPAPKEYRVPPKVAFSMIRDLLAEVSYNFGDRWHVSTADTQAGRIAANLRFTNEQVRMEADARGHIHTRKERLQRFIGLDVHVKDTASGTTVIQLDFNPKVEGANFFACDSIISALSAEIESALGAGSPVGTPADTKLSAPPWWLLVLSALALLGLCGDVIKAVFQ